MSIEERARKIAKHLSEVAYRDDVIDEAFISAELRAVQEEARNKTHCKTHCGCFAYDQAYAQGKEQGIFECRPANMNGYKRGLLRAAEIVERWPGDGGFIAVNDPTNSIDCMNSLRRGVAGCIRKEAGEL